MPSPSSRFSSQAGIAIGPILFVLAMLAVLAAVMSSGSGGFSTASVTDRIAADITTQVNLIRAKINECNIKYGTNLNFDGYPSSIDGSNALTPTLVSALECEGDATGAKNLWTGARPLALPPPTAGFNAWYYVNTNTTGLGGTATGGRCLTIAPTSPNPNNTGVVAGLTKAASKFTHATSNDGASEVNYNPASASQKFIVWVTVPAQGSEDSNCTP